MERATAMERTDTRAARRPRRASLVAALVATVLSIATIAYAASLTLTPNYDWYTKDPGASTYEISNAPQMLGLAYLTNGLADLDGDGQAEGAVDFSGKTVNQTADITFRNASGYIPVGTPDHPFNGTFDGQGHQITNLAIDCGSESTPASKAADGTTVPATSTTCYVGLFGYCGADSTLENVTIGNTVAIRVVDPVTSATGATGALDEAVTADTVIHDVGSLVGYTAGSVSGVTSYATVTATNNLAATDDDPEVVLNVGGIAGTTEGNMSSCAGAGDVTVTAPTLAPDTQDCVVANVGGLVGTLGATTDDGRGSISGTITDCTYGYSDDSGYFGIGTTQVTLHVVTTGVGGLDRFGVEKEATSISVGGIAGYSYGSIANCTNYALVNTNSTDARMYKNSQSLVRIVDAADPTPTTYPAAEDLFTIANGGSGVGGVVGTLRAGGMSAAGIERTDVGSADSAITLTQSFNMGTVVGLAHTGGIAGSVGSYATIDSCRNGKVSVKGTGTADDCGHVVTTRWNKPMTGGIVGATYSNVSNCCNLSEVENIQTGYYTAGIVGSLRSPDTYTAECYACFNSGQVHVASYATQSYREAGLVGNNAGYLHDSVMRSGCVLAHDDDEATYPNAAIGDDSWGMWSNVTFASVTDLKKSETAAVLNAAHAQDVLTLSEQDWTYWYISGVGYPVLNVWDEPTDRTSLTSTNVSATCVTFAEYAGTAEAIPDLIITYTSADGTQSVLVQNVDYYVIPQKGACAMTSLDADTTPYQASIIGIGNYQGTVQNVCSYGIGPCDLSNCSVSTSSESYDFGTQVYPDEVYVTNPAGAQLDASEFRYEIYDGDTYALTSGNQKRGVLYDSEGYVSWDGGATRQSVSSAHDRLTGDLTGTDYILYNADGETIFKVENGTQYIVDPLTSEATEGNGPIYYKPAREGVSGGGLAGYIVKVSARSESKNLKSDSWTTGQYVVDPIDLYKGATIDHVNVSIPTADGTSTQSYIWYWNSEKSTLYTLDANGDPVLDESGNLKQASLPFTGSEVEPTVSVTYQKEDGTTVTIPEDRSLGYYLVYGDPYTKKVDLAYTNRDATPLADLKSGETEGADAANLREQLKDHEKAAVTVRAILNLRYSNYVHMYFGIDPAQLDTCSLSLAGTPVAETTSDDLKTFAYTGGYAVRPTITVTLAGNQLEKGTDYTVAYDNNTAETTDEALAAYYETGDTSGLASYTVTGLGNVTGSYTGYFAIKGGTNLAEEGYTIKAVDDQQYNFGQPVQAPGGVTLVNSDSSKPTLVEGVDYTVTYTNNVYVGVAGISVQGINAYTGRLTAQFNIRQFDVAANMDTRTTGWVYERSEWETNGVEYGYGTGVYMRGYAITDWTTGALDKENTNLIEFEWTAVNKSTGEVFRKTSTSESSAYMTPGEYTVTYTPYCMVAIQSSNSALTYQNMFTGTLTREITVTKQDIAKRSWLTADDVAYNGQPQEVMATSSAHTMYWMGGDMKKLNDPDQFDVQYQDNVTAGTATYTVRALAQSQLYTGTYVGTFNITKLDVSKAAVTVADQLYTGKALTPQVTVAIDGQTLAEGTDYTVKYANNTNKGTATVTVSGMGNCEGTTTATFNIGNRLNLAQAQVSTIADQLYTGDAVTPKPQVVLNGKELTEGADYTLSYSNNTDVSTEKAPAKVTITGKSGTNYAGSSITVSFNIVKTRDIAGAQAAEIPDQVYTGSAITPEVAITYDGKTLVKGTDYTVEYRRNVKAGAPATVVVKGTGTFESQLEVLFNIVVKNGEVTRAGEDAETSQQFALTMARHVYPQGAQGVIIANERDYAGQIAAASYGTQRGWPVLLTTGNGQSLDTDTLSYLRECGATQALVLGDADTVATQVQTALETGLNLQVQRLNASDAQALACQLANLLIAQEQSTAKSDEAPAAQTTAVIANPDDIEGSAAAAAYAAAKQVPVYYTASDGTVDSQTETALTKLKTVVIVGDCAQVDVQVEGVLDPSANVTRLAGETRFAQNAAVTASALENGLQATNAVLVNVSNLTQQLTALALCAQSKAPLVLASMQSMQSVEALAAAELPAYGITLLGGESAFPDTLAAQVTQTMNW